MLTLLLSIGLVFALALLFAWLTRRAGRAQRAIIKWPGQIGAGLLSLVCLLAVGLAGRGLYRVYQPPSSPAATLQVMRTPATVAHGERLANLCTSCHASTNALPLDGGREDFTDGALGVLYAPNLTPGGPLQDWTDGEIVRAIRQGVNRAGRALLIMPSDNFKHMSDADVTALVAYLRTGPVSTRSTPATQLNLLGALVIGAGLFPLHSEPASATPVTAPPRAATAAYGAYLTKISGCAGCHGENLQGGATNDFVPSGPSLPAIVATWNEGDFVKTIRTGVDPYGHAMNPAEMPWRELSAAYADDELGAMYAYIQTLASAR